MQVANISWGNGCPSRHNNPLLPVSIRGVIIGKSGCGKTTLLNNLLLRPGWLDYDNLFVYGKSLFQPEYKILKKAFELGLPKEAIVNLYNARKEILGKGIDPLAVIEAMGKSVNKSQGIEAQFYESADDVLDPSDINPTNKNLMIFDDLILEKQNKCEKYYVRGRHSNVDCFYLCQNYFKLPRQTIRENANFFCLFPQDMKNVNHIYNDHVGDDMTKEQFKKLCRSSWEEPHGFVTIDLSSGKRHGKYRSGLDKFYIP